MMKRKLLKESKAGAGNIRPVVHDERKGYLHVLQTLKSTFCLKDMRMRVHIINNINR